MRAIMNAEELPIQLCQQGLNYSSIDGLEMILRRKIQTDNKMKRGGGGGQQKKAAICSKSATLRYASMMTS